MMSFIYEQFDEIDIVNIFVQILLSLKNDSSIT